VVFTPPHELIPFALQNPNIVYSILFRTVSQALLTVAADVAPGLPSRQASASRQAEATPGSQSFPPWLLKEKKWVVYAKEPFAGPQHVIRYLAHYTHRLAISNGRLLGFENGQVSFRWRDSAHGNQQKAMTLDAVEFMRRFLAACQTIE
jgi:hypothetical protein